jgi:hypothetical protein
MVTSLHDGMNLVAKEFVAARDDVRGVLVLSQFTGAANELHEALIVNPYHVEQTAEALYQGLTMPEYEQRERMRSMRALVQDFNVYRWAGRMLLDAARVRQREKLAARIGQALFMGDDETDEDVFRLADPRILSVCVGTERTTAARYGIGDQQQLVLVVRELLWMFQSASAVQPVSRKSVLPIETNT